MATVEDLVRLRERAQNISSHNRFKVEAAINGIMEKPPEWLGQLDQDQLLRYVSDVAADKPVTNMRNPFTMGMKALSLPGHAVEYGVRKARGEKQALKKTAQAFIGKREYRSPEVARTAVNALTFSVPGIRIGKSILGKFAKKAPVRQKLLQAPQKRLATTYGPRMSTPESQFMANAKSLLKYERPEFLRKVKESIMPTKSKKLLKAPKKKVPATKKGPNPHSKKRPESVHINKTSSYRQTKSKYAAPQKHSPAKPEADKIATPAMASTRAPAIKKEYAYVSHPQGNINVYKGEKAAQKSSSPRGFKIK